MWCLKRLFFWHQIGGFRLSDVCAKINRAQIAERHAIFTEIKTLAFISYYLGNSRRYKCLHIFKAVADGQTISRYDDRLYHRDLWLDMGDLNTIAQEVTNGGQP